MESIPSVNLIGTSNTLNKDEKANQDILVPMYWTETTGFEV